MIMLATPARLFGISADQNSVPASRTLFDRATNGARFRASVTDTLVPVLWPGDAVILDNLQPHKVTGVRQAIEAAGAKPLYRPSYSPDFNSIE